MNKTERAHQASVGFDEGFVRCFVLLSVIENSYELLAAKKTEKPEVCI